MKLKIINLVFVPITALFFSFVSIFPIQTVFAADDISNICDVPGVSQAIQDASGCNDTGDELRNVIINIINVIMGLIALVAVVAIIIGGVQYMTSTGDPGKIKKAKDTILYAVIGLVVVALAATIVNFVIRSTTSSTDSTTKTSLIRTTNITN